jgi:hypothetical protein
MRKGRVRGGRAATALGVLLAFSAVAVVVPAPAAATDSDLKHAFAFRVEASNGYDILAFASNQRADGQGDIALIVSRGNASVIYVAAARLTATSIEADLGRLGEVSLEVMPSGKTRKVRMSCEGEGPETVSFEPQSYRGSFEFHGEEGFTEATTSSPTEYTRFFFDLICGSVGGGESYGARLPGARLGLRSHRGSSHLRLQVNKNRPGARARFEVESKEERQGIWISRTRTLRAGAGAFDYDRLLETATLAPPAPFSGHATFHRGAATANRWSGNLTVDLPGRSDVPLTGAGIEATLVPACRHEGKSRLRC